MRLSSSFSAEEVLWTERLLMTLQRGGDVSGLMREPESTHMLRHFVKMKARLAGAEPQKPHRVCRLPDGTLAECLSLVGRVRWDQLADRYGMSKRGLQKAVAKFKRRQAANTQSFVAAAE